MYRARPSSPPSDTGRAVGSAGLAGAFGHPPNIALSMLAIAVLVAAALAGRLSLTSGLLLNEGTALLIIANAAAAPPGNNAGAVRTGLPGLMLGSHHRP